MYCRLSRLETEYGVNSEIDGWHGNQIGARAVHPKKVALSISDDRHCKAAGNVENCIARNPLMLFMS